MTDYNREQIEKYLFGQLSADDQTKFELALQDDAEFQAEFQLQKDIHFALNDNDAIEVESIMDSIQTRKDIAAHTPVKPKRNKTLLIIAIITGLLSGAFLIFNQFNKTTEKKIDQNKLYAQFHQQYEAYGINRSETTKTVNDLALIAYSAKKYKEAIQFYSDASSPNNKDKFYHASSLQAIGQYDQALVLFEEIIGSEDYEWMEQSLWYAALSELKLGRLDSSKKRLLQLPDTSKFYAQAAALSKML